MPSSYLLITMKYKYLPIYFLFALSLLLFISCEKQTIDENIIELEEVTPIEILCDLSASINTDLLPAGVLSVDAIDGIGPFVYNWSTGDSTSSIEWSSTVETFVVTVTDAEGCTAEAEWTQPIDPCGEFQITLIVPVPIGPLLSVSTTGGTAPYSYLWSTGENTPEIEVLTDGVFGITVTDSEGCIAIATGTVIGFDPCNSFEATISINHAGDIAAFAVGGAAPYVYEWSNGGTGSSSEIGMDSIFTVTVTDANGCVVVDQVDLDLLDSCDSLEVVISEEPPESGTLFANVIGGTQPYLYEWSNGLNSFVIGVDTTGTFAVTVTDSNGCVASDEINLE